MTVLQSLVRYYDRLSARGDAPPFGWADVRFGLRIDLNAAGEPSEPAPLGDPEQKVLRAPAPVGRTSGIASNFLWDKPAYSLGVVLLPDGSAGQGKRTLQEQAAFRELNLQELEGATDPGLCAFVKFLERWTPETFIERGWPAMLLERDQNIAFTYESEPIFARPAAAELVNRRSAPIGERGLCLVTGKEAPIATTHTQLKGIAGAQSSGAALVSFNADAFVSRGQSQGANAPVSEQAAFKYTTALNWLLGRGNPEPRRILYRLGHSKRRRGARISHFRTADATVVFWAELREDIAANEAEDSAAAAEDIAEAVFNDGDWGDDAEEDERDADSDARPRLDDALRMLAKGRPALPGVDDALLPDVRLHILGLSPNNARIAVRFWVTTSIADFARHVLQHHDDLRLEPPAFDRPPSVSVLLRETAAEGKFDNIAPQLAGQVMRSVLTGERYPRTLLSAAIGRIRADKYVSPARVAINCAVVRREIRRKYEEHGDDFVQKIFEQEGITMGLNKESQNTAYNLGRLFAVYEYAEKSYASRNATIRDKYIGSASSTPRRVFPIIMRGFEHNISSLGKRDEKSKASAFRARKAVEQIIERFDGEIPFPDALRLDEQASFFVGYYHQFGEMYKKSKEIDTGAEE